MSKKDAETKQFFQDTEHFADAFNYFLFNGENRINPNNLKELDSTQVFKLNKEKRNAKAKEIRRDVFKQVSLMTDNKVAYLLLGIENQSIVDYTMPVRNMLYDASRYDEQVQTTKKDNRKNKLLNNRNFVSGFTPQDKLIPIITLVVYWGADEWIGPRDLHSMLDCEKKYLKYISNYKINLICPYEMNEKDIEKFSSDMRDVMLYIKYQNDSEKLSELVKADKIKPVPNRTATFVKEITNAKFEIKEGEEYVDMCKAEREWVEKEVEAGRKDERAKMMKGYLTLINENKISLEDAATALNMSVEEFKEESNI